MRDAVLRGLGLGVAISLGLATAALAADQTGGHRPGMMHGQKPMGPGIQKPMGPGMMQGQDMMQGQGMMRGHGMMDPGMMQGHGMMGSGMMQGKEAEPGGGLLGLEGRRVVPMVRLSADDVRLWLEAYLEQIGNPRLKLGSVDEVDDTTVRAEIVTVDDSLVESLAVDRRTGLITSGG